MSYSFVFRHSRTYHRTLLSYWHHDTRRLHSTVVNLDVGPNYVLHKKASSARMFILSRPQKLNALNLSMIRNIGPQLKAWDMSHQAKVILMKGTGPGNFSVGDDMLDIMTKAQAKDSDALYYFQEKSALVQALSTLHTPYIAILDGYALGGAAGLFAHSPFRIATDKTIFAMPEASLGAFMNSGASFFLPKLDGEMGAYLALTGARLEGIDTFYAGIATHYIASDRVPALEDRLIDLESSDHDIIQQVLENFVEPVPTAKVGYAAEIREVIDRCFRYDTVPEILSALEQEKSTTWIRETRRKLLSLSPTSLQVTLKALRKGRTMSLCQCLKMEFDLMQKFLVTKDFHEGVTAILASKPRRKPEWQPASIHELNIDDINRLYFDQPSPNTLTLPSPIDMKSYPYARFSLPTEEDIRLAVTGEGPEFGIEGRLTQQGDVLEWFAKSHRGKWGVKEKVLDVLQRKTIHTKDGLVWNTST
ncbi:ClpP/crotonase-like domain-containing protein [Radiomyces spectabilis]|uniref:ClpP/crotonase-like domain-containing protein n=1 Tax=Radiomyces spectabilis TaxID=64574 RepID=UPI00221F20D4|nr:ClpP/crotonase-like domain-containing protein [Radiomyces spectabilis]KAI8393958.1 ClpP/crotonase-like domain-containing protein [Radiomyces spectabilis]